MIIILLRLCKIKCQQLCQTFFLYLNLKKRIRKLSKTENPFVIMMGQSLRRKPYTTQSIIPISKDKNITIDRSSTFFSFTIFINCGTKEAEVKTPATIPITPTLFNIYFLVIQCLCTSIYYQTSF